MSILISTRRALLNGARAFNPLTFDPRSIAGLKLWLAADKIAGLNDGDPVQMWNDLSGNANEAAQATASKRPLYKTNIKNGRPVLRFDGVDDELGFSNFLAATTAAEVFIVVKIAADPAVSTTTSGLWRFGSSTVNTHYPWTDGTIYDDFGTDVRKSTVNPTPSLAAFNLYGVAVSASEWSSRLNGSQLFTTAPNTVGFTTTPRIGRGLDITFLQGDIAEMLLYNKVLSSLERSQVNSYLGAKYGITVS